MRNRRFTTAFIGAAVTLLASLVFSNSASAHTSSTYITHAWAAATDANYMFSATFPTGCCFRDRVRGGATEWTQRGGTNEPDFFDVGNTGNIDPFSCVTPNAIHYRNLDGEGSSTLGITYVCWTQSTGNLFSYQMSFDNTGRDWYTGTGDANDGLLQLCVPSCQDDFWSVATHEFGHAAGYLGGDNGHFAETDSACPDDNNRSTMCPTVSPGTERQRDPTDHDVHTWDGAY
jgi:hypothetical protein